MDETTNNSSIEKVSVCYSMRLDNNLDVSELFLWFFLIQ